MGSSRPLPPTPAQVQYQMEHINDTRVPQLLASHIICFVIACVAVALRFLSRRLARVKYEADDWLIVAALVSMAGFLTCDLIEIHLGLGRHGILLKDPAGMAKAIIASEVLYNVPIFCIKASILYLYHRIFYVSKNFTRILWGTGMFVFAYGSAQALGSIIQCIPIAAVWDPNLKARCVDSGLGGTILAAFNVLTDFVIILIPMPLLWRMHAPTKKKAHIMATFLIAGFVCFASIYRCVVIHTITREEPTWANCEVAIWTITELGMGILCACLPPMRPLFTRTFSRSQSDSAARKEADVPKQEDSDLSLTLQATPSIPSQSKKFAHLGVLNDIDIEGGDMKKPDPARVV